MQKHCTGIIAAALLLILGTFVFSAAEEPFGELFTLYDQKDFKKLQLKVQLLAEQHPQRPETRFFRALFETDGEKAVKTYTDVYKNSSGRIRYLAAEKLMQYYYARGLYLNASKYQKYLADNAESEKKKIVESGKNDREDKDELYQIQVGAFGIRDNAQQLSSMLETQNIKSQIIIKNVEGKKLYCVWVEGYNSFEKTLEFANQIKARYELGYRIIKE